MSNTGQKIQEVTEILKNDKVTYSNLATTSI